MTEREFDLSCLIIATLCVLISLTILKKENTMIDNRLLDHFINQQTLRKMERYESRVFGKPEDKSATPTNLKLAESHKAKEKSSATN